LAGGDAWPQPAVTDNPVLFDRMLALGHYGRLKAGQAKNTFDTDYLSLGVKYRPHLYGILLATGSLSRLAELNRRRQRSEFLQAAQAEGVPISKRAL